MGLAEAKECQRSEVVRWAGFSQSRFVLSATHLVSDLITPAGWSRAAQEQQGCPHFYISSIT